MIEFVDLSGTENEYRLRALDQKSADEFLAKLKTLPEEERDEQIKFMHMALAEGSRMLVRAHIIINGYEDEKAEKAG